jgi:peptide chain release factor
VDGAHVTSRPRKHRAAIVALRMSMGRSIEQRMKELGVLESELEEIFARSGGPGGQNVNKVSTAVTLRHLPSGLRVTAQDSRSQARNRALARERLLDAIERRRQDERAVELSRREKLRRQRSPRPRALKRRILEGKRRRSKLKKLRTNVDD